MQLKTLQRSGNPLASPREQMAILQDIARWSGISFQRRVGDLDSAQLNRRQLFTLQVNLGRVCNQTCTHCHVDAGPDRRESMSLAVAEHVIEFLSRSQVQNLDVTGGAPEMNPNFRWLIQQARRLGKQVIDRCNLTILLANGFEDMPEFFAENQVNVIASLPCYLEQNCDAQRGDGVFVKSIDAIRRLNQLGYGQAGSGLKLDLVYNPVGTSLPPDQLELELAYREQLHSRYSIAFNQLFTITNMPVSRYLDDLLQKGMYEQYMQKLMISFNPATVAGLMCRTLLSVDWQGYLYDCDFNQMLDMPILSNADQRLHISELSDDLLVDRTISTGNHCYGCTAGCGSSCGGSLV